MRHPDNLQEQPQAVDRLDEQLPIADRRGERQRRLRKRPRAHREIRGQLLRESLACRSRLLQTAGRFRRSAREHRGGGVDEEVRLGICPQCGFASAAMSKFAVMPSQVTTDIQTAKIMRLLEVGRRAWGHV